jgi:hypothetical protein
VAVFASFAKAGQFNRHPAENPRSFDFAQGRLCLSKNRTDKGRAPSAVRSEERLGQPPVGSAKKDWANLPKNAKGQVASVLS